VAALSKAFVCGRSLPGIAESNTAGGVDVCLFWVVLLSDLCIGPITRAEELYRVWWVSVWSWSLNNEETLTH